MEKKLIQLRNTVYTLTKSIINLWEKLEDFTLSDILKIKLVED